MVQYSTDIVRGLILGTVKHRKCPQCESTGFQNWDIHGNDIKSGKSSESDRCNGKCDNCDGLGFILDTEESS